MILIIDACQMSEAGNQFVKLSATANNHILLKHMYTVRPGHDQRDGC